MPTLENTWRETVRQAWANGVWREAACEEAGLKGEDRHAISRQARPLLRHLRANSTSLHAIATPFAARARHDTPRYATIRHAGTDPCEAQFAFKTMT
jgi:hypothetical protein